MLRFDTELARIFLFFALGLGYSPPLRESPEHPLESA